MWLRIFWFKKNFFGLVFLSVFMKIKKREFFIEPSEMAQGNLKAKVRLPRCSSIFPNYSSQQNEFVYHSEYVLHEHCIFAT